MVLRTSFIKAAAIGLAVACTSLFAKATDTPNQYQQNDWFAEFGGNTSMYVNPAGISETDQIEFSVAFFSSTGGEASQEYVSLTYPIDYKHTLGISLFENGAPIEGGDSYSEIAVQFGYAYRLFHLLSLGVNLDVLYINQFDDIKIFMVLVATELQRHYEMVLIAIKRTVLGSCLGSFATGAGTRSGRAF